MTILSILLLIVGILAAVSIILAVINLLQISSVSSKISRLESEIDKKTKEFDAIKKERDDHLNERAQIMENTPAEEIDNMLEKGSDDGSQIEIVRSVRTQDSTILSRETASIHRDIIKQYTGQAELQEPSGRTDSPQSFTSSNGYQDNRQNNIHNSTQAATAQQNQQPAQEPMPIKINLYSPLQQTIDLQSAWLTISDSVQKIPKPVFSLDFSGISFLDGKTVGYLEYFAQTAAKYGGFMEFINCSQQTASILQTNPAICGLIKYQ